MQASVHRYDPQTMSGSVLLDDGLEVPFDRDAFWSSGLRLLRLGQRVTIEVEQAPADHVEGGGQTGPRVMSMRLNGI